MKKIWILPLLIMSIISHAQNSFKPVTIRVTTTQQKTVIGNLYALTDSTISLSIDSKIKSEQSQSGEMNSRPTMASTDSSAGCFMYSNHVLITSFSFFEIEKIETPVHNAALAGMLVGALLGARIGVWAGAALDANNTEGQNSSATVAVGFLALNGAIIGALVMPHHKTYAIQYDQETFKNMVAQFRKKYCAD